MKMYKSLCTLLVAATVSSSTPAWGDISVPSCEKLAEGIVRIEKTAYCTDRFGAIYGAAGDKLQDPKILLRIQRSSEYKEAKEGANALYLQMDAVRQKKNSLKLEERVKESTPPPYLQPDSAPAAASEPASDLPPPYLRPGYQEPAPNATPSGDARPSYSYTSPSSASSESNSGRNTSDNWIGYMLVFGGLGLATIGLGLYGVQKGTCDEAPTGSPCDPKGGEQGITFMISGLVVAGLGSYFFFN